MIKVLVCDDHAVVRRGLRQILEESGEIAVMGEASTAQDVIRLVNEQRWTVVVLDISLPGGNGIELIGEIRRARPDARILILTMHPEDHYAVRALRAGAAGFMTKETAPDKLIEAVKRLASGGRYVTPEVAESLASEIAGERKGELHESLSNREFEILKQIASGRTVSQIAAELSLSVKTVSTHRARILKKMNMKTNAELTHYAIRGGLVS